MIKKEYYRLRELDEKCGFTEHDFRYLCESHDVPLTIYVHSQFFLIAERILSLTSRVARGVVCYQGLVELPPPARSSILKSGSVQLKFGYLKNIDGIKMLESVSQELLQTGLEGNFELRQISSIQEIALGSSDAIFMGEGNRELTYHKSAPIYEGLEVKFADLVVQRDSIDWCKQELGLNESAPPNPTSSVNLIESNKEIRPLIDPNTKGQSQLEEENTFIDSLVFDTPLHRVLAKILIKDSSLKAKQIYRLLKSEMLVAVGHREYDSEDILSQMEGDKIIWINPDGRKKRRSCGIGALDDHLTATKKALFEQKVEGFS